MVTVKCASRVSAALFGIVLGVFGFGFIPVYGQPFGGCEVSAWLTLYPGCSVWPELGRGAVLLLPIALLSPRSWNLPHVVVVAFFALALVGGFGGLQQGDYLLVKSVSDIYRGFLMGYPNLLGSLIVWIAWACFPLLARRRSGPQSR